MPRGLEETKGKKPAPGTRDEISKFLYVEMTRMIRVEMSKQLLNGSNRVRRPW